MGKKDFMVDNKYTDSPCGIKVCELFWSGAKQWDVRKVTKFFYKL